MPVMPHNPQSRIALLQTALRDADIDAALFNYSRTLLYYCGTTHPAFLMVTPRDHHLLVLRALEWVKRETWLRARHLSSADGHTDVKRMLGSWNVMGGRLGLELDILPAKVFQKFSRLFPEFDLVDISHILLEQRKTKDAQEIQYTREACRIAHKGHERIMAVLKPGMTELELSAEIEDAHRKAGHEGLYFMRQPDFFMGRGPIASGENLSRIAGKVQSITGVGLSPSIPLGPSVKQICEGEMIVVDIPTHCGGYHCDQSRTY
ncbi:MAG: aminopeptidase P family protein, partial [Deltaproteobacteria bacterium]|nr:aminopeptidase P family protein [Deltaproteobacteria bacterium]